MAQTKHTPGPWHTHIHGAYMEGGYIAIYTEDDLWVSEAKGRGGIRHSKVGPDKNEEIVANALLIAAAPDLLEALTNMVHECDISGSPSIGAFEKSLEAISKAKGTNTIEK